MHRNTLNTTKNYLLDFLEILKSARWRERESDICFILVHSITKLHPVYQGNLSLVSTIIKSFKNHTPRLHFWIIENTKTFDSHKNLNHNPVRLTYKIGITLEIQPEAQELLNLKVAPLANQTWVLQASTKPKSLQDQPRSSISTL